MSDNLKKGSSKMVRSLLLFFLVIFIFMISFVTIKVIISGGVDNFLSGSSRIDLKIISLSESEDSVEISVERRLGKGDLLGIEFLLNDGIEDRYFNVNSTLNETKTQTFNLDYDGIIKEISISPIIENNENKSIVGRATHKIELSNVQIFNVLRNLIFWWNLDNNAEDNIGERNGIMHEIDFVEGIKDEAADFNGESSYIDLGSLNLEKSMSIEFWYNRDTLDSADSDCILGNMEWNFFKPSRKGWIIKHPVNSNSLSFILELTDGKNVKEIELKSPSLKLGEWNHIVCTFDSSKNKINIYANRELVSSVDSPEGYNKIIKSPSSLTVGSLNNGGYFDGKIDELRIYNESLSERKIIALYDLY
jgi:hypothetical protein